ncbi:MAG: hypothetical protein JXM68_13380, partial [Sedimentisphaerales bacterium]|nr:hypothetical protein [Sedimentisphaerales bacterium]
QLIHESANTGAISEQERQANQQEIDSLLASIDRVGQSSSFNSIKLLDGTKDYTITGQGHVGSAKVTDALGATFTSGFNVGEITLKNSYYQQNLASYDLDVNFMVSGVQAHYTWSTQSDFIDASNNGRKASLVISGYKGRTTVNFSGGTDTAAIVAGIVAQKAVTGVSAGLSGGHIVFSSTNFGADAFVSVQGIEPAEVVWTPDSYFFNGAPLGEAGLTLGGLDGDHSYYAGFTNANELAALINADTGITGVAARLSGADMVFYSADQGGAPFISVQKFATYYSDGNFANGSAASVTWNSVSDYLGVLAQSNGSLNVKGVNGNVDISLASGTWTEASLADEINSHTAATGVVASAGAGSVTFTSTTGAGPNFVFVEATDSFSETVQTETFSAAGSGHAIGFNGADFVTSDSDWNDVTDITLSNYIGLMVDGSGESQQFSAATRATINATGQYNGSGGMEFALDSYVQSQSDVVLGLPEINTSNMGSNNLGKLNSLKSGGDNALSTGNYINAASVVGIAVKQVASLRGRIGAFTKYTVESTIRVQQTRLENITSARSAILDTDFATEIANMTRQQILKQSGLFMLQAANAKNQSVLQLLQNM